MIHAEDHYDQTHKSQIATSPIISKLYGIRIYNMFPPMKPICGVSTQLQAILLKNSPQM